MERIQALIDKLYQQKQQNSNPAQLLFTVQLLQAELLKLQQKNGTLGTSKVAVTLPVNMNLAEDVIDTPVVEEKKEEPVAKPMVTRIEVQEELPQPSFTLKEEAQRPSFAPKEEVHQPSFAFQEEVPQPSFAPQEYSLRRPIIAEEVTEEPVSRFAPRSQEVLNPAFSSTVETPTLSQYQPKKEVNEAIAEKRESLNDRLKQQKTEVAHVLKEAPIKDLRKGIGINDRFTFVRELFRGDEAFYERSIKTINGFHIFSEAEYWINRELKFKIGWDEDKEIVKHFYQLVRRRFS